MNRNDELIFSQMLGDISLCRHSREHGNLCPVKALRDPRFRGDDGSGDFEKVSQMEEASLTARSDCAG